MSTTTNLFCVVYRTGGTINYTWHRLEPSQRQRAEIVAEELRRIKFIDAAGEAYVKAKVRYTKQIMEEASSK